MSDTFERLLEGCERSDQPLRPATHDTQPREPSCTQRRTVERNKQGGGLLYGLGFCFCILACATHLDPNMYSTLSQTCILPWPKQIQRSMSHSTVNMQCLWVLFILLGCISLTLETDSFSRQGKHAAMQAANILNGMECAFSARLRVFVAESSIHL